jgi:ribonuclease HI
MELVACIKALRWVRENQPWSDVTRVQIVTDSTYVTDNISYRARGWKKNKWRNRFGKPMANDDLWNDLLAAHTKTGIRVDFVWQPGKKSATGKIVDKAAKAAAQRGGIDKDRGYRPGAACRSLVQGGIAQSYPAKGQTDVIRPYAKKIMKQNQLQHLRGRHADPRGEILRIHNTHNVRRPAQMALLQSAIQWMTLTTLGF